MREDLREHIDNPEYFDQNTDSYHIVQAIKLLSGNPLAWFACYEIAVDRLLVKFAKPHKETTMLLAEKGMLDFKVLYEMFNRWDATFFPEGKVKSDVRKGSSPGNWHKNATKSGLWLGFASFTRWLATAKSFVFTGACPDGRDLLADRRKTG